MNIELILQNAKSLQQYLQRELDTLINGTGDTFSHIISRFPEEQKSFLRQFKRAVTTPPNAELGKARYAVNFNHYLNSLLQGLDENPQQWIQSFEQYSEKIEETLGRNSTMSSLLWKRCSIPEMKQLVTEIQSLKDSLARVTRAGTQELLENALQPLFEKVKDLTTTSSIHSTSTQHEEEILLFKNLYNSVLPLVEAYRNPNDSGHPEQEVAKVRHYMEEQLPEELHKYGDSEISRKIKEFFKENKKSPLIRPATILAFIERILTYLQQENTRQSRFGQSKQKVVSVLEKEISSKEKTLASQIKNVKTALTLIQQKIQQFEVVANEAIEGSLEKEELITNLLNNILSRIFIVDKIIQEATSQQRQDVLTRLVEDYKLRQEQESKILKSIRNIERVVDNRTRVAAERLDEVKLVA